MGGFKQISPVVRSRDDKMEHAKKKPTFAEGFCGPRPGLKFIKPFRRHPFWSSSNRLSTTILKRPANYPQSLFSAKARPDPDFRYFSNSKAFSSFEKAT